MGSKGSEQTRGHTEDSQRVSSQREGSTCVLCGKGAQIKKALIMAPPAAPPLARGGVWPWILKGQGCLLFLILQLRPSLNDT